MKKQKEPKPIIILTILLWIIVFLSISWLVVSCIWWILGKVFFGEIFIPPLVNLSFYSMITLALWIVLVYFLFRKIRKQREKNIKYNYELEYDNNQKWEWSEMEFDSKEYIKNNAMTSMLDMDHIKKLTPSELLSLGVTLEIKGDILNSMSILRIIIDDNNAPQVIKYAADEYLRKLLVSNFTDQILYFEREEKKNDK